MLVLVSDTGSIGQTGQFSVGANGSSFTTSSANETIALMQANLLGGHSVGLNTSGAAGNASITSANAMSLGTSTIGGTLTAVASNGNITQTGAVSTGGTGSSYTAGGTVHGIDLSIQATTWPDWRRAWSRFFGQSDKGTLKFRGRLRALARSWPATSLSDRPWR